MARISDLIKSATPTLHVQNLSLPACLAARGDYRVAADIFIDVDEQHSATRIGAALSYTDPPRGGQGGAGDSVTGAKEVVEPPQ